ncbi:MAG TPA: GNAT family N-acetyltransferase [Ignavibacteria bacterium]|nr:GNAT family N-acetyltransferase [Ignavibacteria bacterium]
MKIEYKTADYNDIEDLIRLIKEFHHHEKIKFEEKKIVNALQVFFKNAHYGKILMIKNEHELIGYAVVSFVFSIEFGGLNVSLDQFFIKEKFRGKGIGTNTLKFIENECNKEGVQTIHLQVFKFNREAERLYLRHGYQELDRIFMNKELSY